MLGLGLRNLVDLDGGMNGWSVVDICLERIVVALIGWFLLGLFINSVWSLVIFRLRGLVEFSGRMHCGRWSVRIILVHRDLVGLVEGLY